MSASEFGGGGEDGNEGRGGGLRRRQGRRRGVEGDVEQMHRGEDDERRQEGADDVFGRHSSKWGCP